MASISLPPQPRAGFAQHFDSSPQPDTIATRRLTMPPLPNPPFVFPARDPDATDQETDRRTPPALPAFSFNPGVGKSLQPSPSPAPHPNPRGGGHRRRPSEFVGGDQLVTPDTGVAAEKRDEPPSPTPQPAVPSGPPPGRGPGRRHHAHRRSAAVSGVDLNAIQKALGSNPVLRLPLATAPLTLAMKIFNARSLIRRRALAAQRLQHLPNSPPVSSIPPVPPIPSTIHIQPAPKTEDPEIGRPGSAASQEASRIPADVPLQPSDNPGPIEQAPVRKRTTKPRPKTADASLAFDLMQSQNTSDVAAIKRSKSTGHTRARKSVSARHINTHVNTETDAHSTDTSRPSFSDDGSESPSDTEDEGDDPNATKKLRSKKKKQKRVRHWAGSLLGRSKGKRHAKPEAEKSESPERKEKKAPRPPALTRTNSEVGSFMEVDFDNDDVVVLRTPTSTEAPVSAEERDKDIPPVPTVSLESAWKPRSFYEQTAQDEVLSSPIIDLDAALGPFNTPDMRPAKGNLSKFTVASQRMYSGGRRGEFVGPEMRYHRRTESAPIMTPFDRSSLGPIRLGGATGVETPDVFYEEEEDEFLAANQSPRSELVSSQIAAAFSSTSEEDIQSVKSDDTSDTLTRAPESTTETTPAPANVPAPIAEPLPETTVEPTPKPRTPRHQGLGIQAPDKAYNSPPAFAPTDQKARQPSHSANPFGRPPRSPVEILRSEDSVARAPGPPSPDVSPGFLAVDKRPATSPHELQPNIPPLSLSAGVSPSDSSFPSPDAPRLFNDRYFSSHSYHHLPSDYYNHASVEDVPSLTSSASTMTNTMNRFSASFFPRARLSTDRAASFSAAVNRRSSQANASKRSSLASLSKLVGGPHSERSKLYQEEKPPGDSPDKSRKKGRRLSRLMHFWKLKDKEKTSTITEAETPSEHP
ncbi:hypothetical protein N7481_009389 [Penicillium waksmanii]|uniref:uncharacterized protein n=1 Tax=Penicillium waksmanii TaxID=69791 RepID=UPI0025498A10|nr:uncharacterized protein N7481_009389 [Penicillium waksmanii]KAJ5975682.1 hypothetical protein N7481_009389 [Penicillium waksmanii]